MPARLSQRFASLGEFGGDIVVDFEPDPSELANAILQVVDQLDNIIVPLEASKVVAREDMQRHFDEETAPDGSKWTPLSDETAEYKERRGFPSDILRRSGALEDTATSDAAWHVAGSTVFFNTSILPVDDEGRPYWYFHQIGAETTFSVDVGGGETLEFGWSLPARPFIGLSDEAQLSIIEIFDTWFDESIMAFQRPSGHIQIHRGAAGFGPIVGR